MRLFIAGFCLMLLFFSTSVHAKIVFAGAPNGVKGVKGIYVMDDDGSNVKLLTETKHWGTPRWSPDGKQIVFKNGTALYLMNEDGSNIRQLTHPVRNREFDQYPTFSPDGKSVLFERTEEIDNGGLKFNICVINIMSGKIKKITEINIDGADWSPDGKDIIFARPIGLGIKWSGNIWIMESNGRHARELTDPIDLNNPLQIAQWQPRWSPDGKKILYRQQEFTWEKRDDPNTVWLIRKAHRYIVCDRNGKTLQRLSIPKDFRAVSFDWMNGGKSVVLSGYKYKLNEKPPAWGETPPYNIYKYNIRTGSMTRLTDHTGDDWMLDWIDDHAHAVTPKGKQLLQWGKLKTFLNIHRGTFKTFSRNLSIFLRRVSNLSGAYYSILKFRR